MMAMLWYVVFLYPTYFGYEPFLDSGRGLGAVPVHAGVGVRLHCPVLYGIPHPAWRLREPSRSPAEHGSLGVARGGELVRVQHPRDVPRPDRPLLRRDDRRHPGGHRRQPLRVADQAARDRCTRRAHDCDRPRGPNRGGRDGRDGRGRPRRSPARTSQRARAVRRDRRRGAAAVDEALVTGESLPGDETRG